MFLSKYKILGSAFVLFTVFLCDDAHAYLDPGTGTYLLQMLAAAIFGGLFFIKQYWTKLKVYFGHIFAKKDDKKDE